MTLDLNPSGVFGKRTARDDFDVLCSWGGTLPPAAVAVASTWLQVALTTSNRAVAALQRVDGDWWVFKAEREPLTDAASRPMGFVMLGQLTSPLPPLAVPALLLHLARGPASRSVPPPGLPTQSTPAEPSPAAAEAALALALGHAAAVRLPGELAAVLDGVGLEECGWVAFLPDEVPARLPTSPGLLLTQDQAPTPRSVRELASASSPRQLFALPLSSLPRAAPTPDARAALVRVALGSARSRDVSDSPDALGWLLAAGIARPDLLRDLAGVSLQSWLESGRATADDLDLVRPHLNGSHRLASRKLLRPLGDAVARYTRLFPDDLAGALELLPSELANVWQRLARGESVTADEAQRFLDGPAGESLAAALTLVQAALLAQAGSHAGKQLLVARLEGLGVAGLLARAAVLGEPLDARPPLPAAPPSFGEWLPGVAVDHWLRIGTRLREDDALGRWWLQGLSWFVERGQVPQAELTRLGVELHDPALLRLAGAPHELVALAQRDGPRVRLPPAGAWPAEGDRLLAALARDGSLLDRLEDPGEDDGLRAAAAWLQQRGGDDVFRLIGQFRQALWGQQPASPTMLRRVARLMSRSAVLRQVAAWAAVPHDERRWRALDALLRPGRLTAPELAWLEARTRRCLPLPPLPDWTARELLLLFPLLDPVEVVRRVLARDRCDAEDAELLARVKAALTAHPQQPPGVFPDVARAAHPDWVRELSQLSGWEWCAGAAAQLELIRASCRRLGACESVAEADRQAIERLARH